MGGRYKLPDSKLAKRLPNLAIFSGIIINEDIKELFNTDIELQPFAGH